jgi:hypothetical protein
LEGWKGIESTSPSPAGALVVISHYERVYTVAIAELEDEKKESSSELMVAAYEIECPRCYGLMSLCSDFDALFYACEECDFLLHFTRK